MTISTAQYLAMRSQLRAALSGASDYGIANPSDADLNGLFNQLITDSSGVSIAANVLTACASAARSRLGGALPSALNPSDQDVLDFFTQLKADSSGAAALSARQYAFFKDLLRATLSANSPSAPNPSLTDTLGYISAVAGGFNGSYASLFPGAYLVLQTDRGFSYGSTPRATAGNTSATVLTLAGTISGVPVPVLVKATNTATVGSGAQFSISFDGGSTFAMTSVALGTTPTALTGAGSGLTLAATAASSVTNDTWKATNSALADQSGNNKNAVQATAGAQPIVTPGLNGKVGLLFDGVDDLLISTIVVPYPAQVLLVGRSVVRGASDGLCGGDNPWSFSIAGTATQYQQYAGSFVNAVTNALTTNQRFAAAFTNSTSDSLKVGSGAVVTGANAGSVASTKWAIGGFADGVRFANMEFFAAIISPVVSYAAFDAALNTSAGYGAASIAV